ncbi:MAG: hypothetical protein ACRDB0_01355 [Paraclostridium sp.]
MSKYYTLEYTDAEKLKQFENTVCNFQYEPIKIGVPTVFHSIIDFKGKYMEDGVSFNTIETSDVIAVSEGEHIIIETVTAMYHFKYHSTYTTI